MISERVQRIGASPTLKISAKAKAMRAEGLDVVDLSVGEPDFPTPENIKEAGIKAIRDNFTKYTESDGILALRKAIAKRLKEDYGVEYGPKQIIVSAGAKASLFHVVQALVNEGEEVIVPAPYWVTYPECIALAKGKPVIVPTREEDGFRLTPEALKSAISPATKAVILNNPSNPTGGAYTKDQLLALAEVVKGEDLYVIADEIYASLAYDNFKFTSFAALGEDIRKKTVLVNGVSKSYSMTGWRIGFTAGPPEVIDGMSKIQSHTTSNACSIAQKAALEAYEGPQYEVQKMVAEFQRRRNYCLMRLAAVPGLACFKPQGAFYLFPNVKSFYDKEANGAKIRNSYGLAYYLLKEARVAIVPGDAFGADDYIRLSYATSMANLEKAMDRMTEALAGLKTAKKVRRLALSNAVTRVKKAVPVEAVADARMRDALVAEMESHLGYEGRYEWNARIGGTVLQLRTNVAHLNDFWVESFPPAPAEADVRPHGVIYAVDGIAGREPRGFYHEATQTGILVNTDLFASLRGLALGLAMDIAARSGGGAAGAVRGMSVDLDGRGLILVGPPGTKKTELVFELLADHRFKLQANDLVFVEVAGGRAQAERVERKLYMPTSAVELDGRLAGLFDRCKCENVVVRKEDCQDGECRRADDCRLDRGSAYCYKAAKEAHALLDPAWLGPAAAVRRTDLRWLVLLRNDATSPAVVELTPEEALRALEAGEAAGARRSLAGGQPQPFYNPHLLGASPEKIEAQRAFFGRLADVVRCVLFNSGAAGAERLKELVASGR
ncbi:MAG TPA: aminotransferase class I/II-fold pyridoxal phosphate-dependent enzyme [Candidatus Aminicenantes bacterium]|nr:aminotransferase class I/II-fold pyridoxal phosphate-dependent enzyme [Candidatus Aminicenantes bacterium]HRY64309.1 aminotransferase class I/II-fold pyridoxal phosphate-dependent enzyme [Candidatus Aminicenantes bacterium]HRZ71222.1 aminotransferase class I/II-fold pyridoxal phosphate-dependent enzyme [Candidatus Aminicenantes bacterium]